MTGNVSEWVADWYGGDYYTRSPQRNPRGPGNGRERVIRGGSWADMGRDLRITRREHENPALREVRFVTGFRCAYAEANSP